MGAATVRTEKRVTSGHHGGAVGVVGDSADVVPPHLLAAEHRAVDAGAQHAGHAVLTADRQYARHADTDAAGHGLTLQSESMACGIGVCMTCVLPVRGEDGVTRMLRSCVDGPVFRGEQVRWDDIGTVPDDTYGAPVVTRT